ncbi:MAG: tRNA dihydrouridine(20/20a) synthase DusA [Roseinatronobacter sp.]
MTIQPTDPTTALANAARLSVAPMMDWTDRHCRMFHRVLSRRALLYTEMVAAPALVRGRALHLLDHSPAEHPVALQLGGSDPAELAEATALGWQAGYREINLNCGCPSDRVQSGCFGAILMQDASLVGRIVAAMIAASPAEVTVKCRIGIDDQDAPSTLPRFLDTIASAGVRRVIIHARKAWLQGLSPKENREIPPLDYDLVLAMKDRFAGLHVSINGGVESLDQAQALLGQGMDGVMIGRAAYHRPADILAQADARIFGDLRPPLTGPEVVAALSPYIADELARGTRLPAITRHMLGLFTGQPGAKAWRRVLSETAHHRGAGLDVVDAALDAQAQAAFALQA